MEREEARLGMEVLFGNAGLEAVVDGMCWDWCGLRLKEGGYVIADWNDVHRKEED